MKSSFVAVSRSVVWRLGLGVGLMVAFAAGVAGCASRTAGAEAAAAAAREPLTQSDEPESRKRARIRMELAVAYFEQGKTEVALDELKQVLVVDPTFPEAYTLRGLIYMRVGETSLAEESFKRAVALNPRDSNALHNHGWLVCQQARYDEAVRLFQLAAANPTYEGRAKTLLAEGVCQVRAGRKAEAERSLLKAYELDAGNPITGFNLANLMYERGENSRSQFYIRRINNSEFANAETLWLGIRVERKLNDRTAMRQLAEQLKKRYPDSREVAAFDSGRFDE